VLDAQQDLLQARVSLVNAQYQRVVGAYTVLSAYGRLDAKTLGLAVSVYDPAEHLNAVRDRWGGLRTPDGR
jgi:outer membrane protein